MDRPNPFESDVVYDPREAEQAVPGLNDRALATLLRRFSRLEAEPHPRRYRTNLKAQLIHSTEPGYGKSHLIGRFFRELRGRAFLIYLRPFQEADSAWRSILAKTVEEMDRADDPTVSVRRTMRPTQLDTFAEGVVGFLMAELIEKEIIGGDYGDDLVRELRKDPAAAFNPEGENAYLRDWIRDQADFLGTLFSEALTALDIKLNAPAATWIAVLQEYCFGESGKREACLDWLKGAAAWPAGPAETLDNAGAFKRLQDFLVLSGLCRPFVFAFDQIEHLTGNPGLMAEFGAVVDELVTYGLNHMVVVAANVEPWKAVVEKNLQMAFRDRFSDPIELDGIREPQARELARRRLAGAGIVEFSRLSDGDWFEELFRGKQPPSVREFLRLCARRTADGIVE